MDALRSIGLAVSGMTVALAAATGTRPMQRLDDALERAVGPLRPRLRRAASVGTLPGEPWAHPAIGASVALAVLAARRGRDPLGILVPLAGASLGAILAHHGVKAVYRRPRPVIALRKGKTEPAYPSGHTADATAVVLTGAYLLVREDLVSPLVAAPCAAGLAIATGASRVALGWHWSTDVVGGWLTGVAVAAACAHEYERRRDRTRSRARRHAVPTATGRAEERGPSSRRPRRTVTA